jgi:hypothetical protein
MLPKGARCAGASALPACAPPRGEFMDAEGGFMDADGEFMNAERVSSRTQRVSSRTHGGCLSPASVRTSWW